MKKLLVKLIFYSLLLGFYTGYSQNTEAINARVLDIKKWYGEIQSIGLKNCKEKTRVALDSFDGETDKMEFVQKIKKCDLNSDYEVLQGEFSGYEWANDINIYKKNGNVFFVFIYWGGEGVNNENRFYFDENQKLIKEIEKSIDYDCKSVKTEKKENLNKSLLNVFSGESNFNSVYKFEFN